MITTPRHPIDVLLRTARQSHDLLLEVGVPHAFTGGLAVNLHGYHRESRDVDVLVRHSDVPAIKVAFGGAGYQIRRRGHAYLSPSQVRVELNCEGEYPEFRDVHLPEGQAGTFISGLPVLSLPELLKAKVAAGFMGQRMGGRFARRAKKHFRDIVGLIQANGLLPKGLELSPGQFQSITK